MRRRYIFGAALTLVLVAVMAIGAIGSGAWFTAEAEKSFSAKAGTLELTAEGVLTIEDLAPSPAGVWTYAGRLYVKNTGTLPLKFRGWLEDVVVTDVNEDATDDIDKLLTVRCVMNPTGTAPSPRYGPPNEELFSNVPFQALYTAATSPITMDFDDEVTEPMPAGFECYYDLYVRLPSTAGNEYQGDSVSGTLVLWATQPVHFNTGALPIGAP